MELVTFDDLQRRIQQHSHHDQLRRADVGPRVSRFHFEIAKTVLQTAHVPAEKGTDVLEALLLLHEGLALHDRVEVETGLRRQLHVLAGDYCSGQYYSMLSRVQDEALLYALCEAVLRINEAKMAFYESLSNAASADCMAWLEVIEGELLLALAGHYLGDSSAWQPEIRSLVRAHVVKEEMVERKVPKYFTMRQAYEWLSDAINCILHVQADTVLQPISSFVMDYLRPTQKYIEAQAYAEGNR